MVLLIFDRAVVRPIKKMMFTWNDVYQHWGTCKVRGGGRFLFVASTSINYTLMPRTHTKKEAW